MADDLVALALDDPAAAEGRPASVIAAAASPPSAPRRTRRSASSLRDQGRLDEALPELRSAVAAAERAGDLELLADVPGDARA